MQIADSVAIVYRSSVRPRPGHGTASCRRWREGGPPRTFRPSAGQAMSRDLGPDTVVQCRRRHLRRGPSTRAVEVAADIGTLRICGQLRRNRKNALKTLGKKRALPARPVYQGGDGQPDRPAST